MAKCDWCLKDMKNKKVVTCTGNKFVDFPDGTRLKSVPYYIDGVSDDHRCHDCNIGLGGYHHPGCDMEECPKCGGQLISCGCLDSEEEEE